MLYASHHTKVNMGFLKLFEQKRWDYFRVVGISIYFLEFLGILLTSSIIFVFYLNYSSLSWRFASWHSIVSYVWWSSKDEGPVDIAFNIPTASSIKLARPWPNRVLGVYMQPVMVSQFWRSQDVDSSALLAIFIMFTLTCFVVRVGGTRSLSVIVGRNGRDCISYSGNTLDNIWTKQFYPSAIGKL